MASENFGRYWNPYGIEKPKEGATLNITCEINFPLEGIDKRIAGAIASYNDASYIVHRGKIGGGKKGVGKSLFWEHYANENAKLENDDPVALIGDIDGNSLIDQIASFVYEVKRIKNSEIHPEEKPGNSVNPMLLKEFFEETSGRKKYSLNAEISAKCNHGPILSELNNKIRDMGLTSEKNRYIDLFVGRNKRSPILFELKTDCESSSIYSAIGQLSYYSIGLLNVNPTLVAVMPHEISDEVKNKIEKLGIKVVTFISVGSNYTFKGLKELW